MYATGHYGMALLAYAPVGYVLLEMAPLLAFLGSAVVLSLATLPDIDLRLPLVPHRGPTHSLLFTALAAGGLGAAGFLLGQGSWQPLGGPVRGAVFGAVLGVVGIGSHLLADILTPMGVNVLWRPTRTRCRSPGRTALSRTTVCCPSGRSRVSRR